MKSTADPAQWISTIVKHIQIVFPVTTPALAIESLLVSVGSLPIQ